MNEPRRKLLGIAARWGRSLTGLLAIWLLSDWFFSTEVGITTGVVLGPLVLLGLALLFAWFLHAFKE